MMEESTQANDKLYFLAGGGEMGELIRSIDWSNSFLGPPENWPQALRTTLGILLHSASPMFLFWGDDLICFYNDSFRPSLGVNGKHPAIGKTGKEVWPEIWDFIGPLINQVMTTGEPVSFEDQLVPFYRNGKIEDIYWTFSYSLVYGDDGVISGTLVNCTETTKTKKALDALRESEDRFRTISEGTNMLISVADTDFNTTYYNKAWSDLTGKPLSEILHLGWRNIMHPDDMEKFIVLHQESLAKGKSIEAEFRIKNKNGEYRWLLAKIPARFTTEGVHAGYISSCIDITEIKNAERALQKSEQQMRSMVETAPFAIGVYIGREMRVEFANKTIMDIWGKGYNVIGKSFRDVLPELDNQEVFKQLDEVYRTGEAFHIKNQLLDLIVDGKVRPYYFNYSLTPLFDNEGKVYGVMNTGVDLTDLNIAKEKIKESEQNLRNMISQAPVAMCIFRGPQHIVELANDRMYELWGRTAEEMINLPIFVGLPEAKDQGFEAMLDGVYNTGKAFSAQAVPITLPRKGSIEVVYVNFVYEAYREGGGDISGILAVAVDVTPQVIAHQKIEEEVAKRTRELADANSSLQKSNAELAQFAYIASHDLQEPLRKINTYSQMLDNRMAASLDEQSRSYLDKINNASTRMNTLIRNVLSYSELVNEADNFKPVDLNEVAESVKTDFELLIEQKGAKIMFDKLPVIQAIPLQMSQLFSNLIGNSLKFARKDVKPVIRISVNKLTKKEKANPALDPALDYVKIQFSDNGIGFKDEYKEQIFKIFQRLHRKSEYEGTGIGLAMCKKIALNHHGDLDASGSSENGAVFNVILSVGQSVRLKVL